MDSDDEFGDLYSDVLVPLTGSSVKPDPNPNPNPNFTAPSVPISSQIPNSNSSPKHALDSLIDAEPNEDWMPDNWDEEDNYSGIKTTIQPEVKRKMETPGIINSKDWDSDDSEDDLNIVLNDDSGMGMGVGEIMEEDKDNLANFDNNDYNQEGNDGYLDKEEDDLEKKEGLDTLKANDAVRCGFGNFQQQQQHSMFKYVRPGAPAVGPPVQIRPPGQPVVPFAGRGRGDWRPAFGQKSFGWANNNASRPFGGGLDFTLPSYKTIFEVDIEVFEEKTWRHPGVDISDYFNFGLDEENWKEYAKQLDQLRMQSTMQSKIRVYESGRSVQEYDPDLPPELAAAANHHDISADNMNPGKIYNVQSDLNGQGKGSPDTQALPVGRPIQVEMSNIERMASMDTRPPRPRYPDVIIEVFSCDHLEDDATHVDASENHEKDLQTEKHNGTDITEVDGHNDSEHYSRSPQNNDDHTRENFEVKPRENESLRLHHKGRSTEEPFPGRNTSAKEKENDRRKSKRETNLEAKKSPKQSISTSETDKRGLSTEDNDNKVDTPPLNDDNDTEDNGTSDSITRPSRKQKLSSQVAPPIKDGTNNDTEDLVNKPTENSLQNGRWRRNDSTRRHKNDHIKEPRHVMIDRKRINSRAYDPYTNRVWEQPYPSRPLRAFERMRNSVDDSVRNKDVSSRARERKDKPEKGENSRRKMEKDKAEDHYHTNRRERGMKDGQRAENTHDDHKSRRAAEKDGKKIVDKRQRKVDESSHEKKKHSSDERSLRVHNGRSSISDSQKVYKDGKRESTRKNTDSDAGVQYSSGHGKRKREDSTHRNEKVSTKHNNGEEKQDNEEDAGYKGETERESKRGRSKMERWSSDIKEVDAVADDEVIPSANETQKAHNDVEASNQDSHLDSDAVEKLKRRSMRFKTPLTSEKDLPKTSPENNQAQVVDSSKAHDEVDVKQERPARKRKWSSSN